MKRRKYIAIKEEHWGKDVDAKQALEKVYVEVDAMHAFKKAELEGDTTQPIKKVYVESDLLLEENLKGTRLIVVDYPEDETEEDDVIFYPNGGYVPKGKAKATHYDEIEIIDFLQGAIT